MKLIILRFLLRCAEWYEDRKLVGHEGCLWPVEFFRAYVKEQQERQP